MSMGELLAYAVFVANLGVFMGRFRVLLVNGQKTLDYQFIAVAACENCGEIRGLLLRLQHR